MWHLGAAQLTSLRTDHRVSQHVQSALGVPLNFTMLSPTVNVAFRSMGDYPRPGWLEYLSYLLDRGIKVTLITGDRDFACEFSPSLFPPPLPPPRLPTPKVL